MKLANNYIMYREFLQINMGKGKLLKRHKGENTIQGKETNSEVMKAYSSLKLMLLLFSH